MSGHLLPDTHSLVISSAVAWRSRRCVEFCESADGHVPRMTVTFEYHGVGPKDGWIVECADVNRNGVGCNFRRSKQKTSARPAKVTDGTQAARPARGVAG